MQAQRLANGAMRQASLRKASLCRRPLTASTRLHAASTNGNGNHRTSGKTPSPAETVRTIVEICNEGTLCTLAADGTPIGTPVSYSLDKSGHVWVSLNSDSLELQNVARDARCSLQIQPTTLPARAVASVTLVGRLQSPSEQQAAYPLSLEKCLYFGGLDQSHAGLEVLPEEVLAAEPDVLRGSALDLVRAWNDERAEDIYRIVSSFLDIPLTEMTYAELLWVDRLGMYVRAEAEGLSAPKVVRVPFYRPVLDERDARSVITMAAQLSWEQERPYSPVGPSVFSDVGPTGAAAAAANNN